MYTALMRVRSGSAAVTKAAVTKAAERAAAARALDGAWERRELVKLLGELDQWDTTVEARKAKAEKLLLWSGRAAALGVAVWFFLSSMYEWAGLFVLVPGGLALWALKERNSQREIDLPDELRKSLRPVLKQLKQDLDPEEKIKGTIRFAGPVAALCKSNSYVPSERHISLRVYVFEESMCKLRLPLADGSTAVLRVNNVFRRLEGTKKNYKGRTKTKTKWRKESTVTATLIPRERVAWDPGRMVYFVDSSDEKLSFPERNGVQVARLSRRYKFKYAEHDAPPVAPGEDIVKMFVRLSGMRPLAKGA